MGDEELQTLVRRVKADDPAATTQLEARWGRLGLSAPHEFVKIGRGWNGRRLLWNKHGNMAAEGTEHVYRWLAADYHGALEIELVYVPGGEIACDPAGLTTVHHSARTGKKCKRCNGAGNYTVAPFYLGRYPVTIGQWWANLPKRIENEREHGTEFCPIAPVAMNDVRTFLKNIGLRLPDEREWLFAAFGGPLVPCLREGCVASGRGGYGRINPATGEWETDTRCGSCGGSGAAARHNPWGNDRATFERCVFGDIEAAPVAHRLAMGEPCTGGTFRGAVPQVNRCSGRLIRRDTTAGKRTGQLTCNRCGTHPGLCGREDEGRIVPARPNSASHFGAFDMAGNVWELLDAPSRNGRELAVGGAFDVEPALVWHPQPTRVELPRSNVGFRVALSAEA